MIDLTENIVDQLIEDFVLMITVMMVKLPWMRRALTMTVMTRMTSAKPSMMTITKQCHAFSLNEINRKCSG